MGRGRSGRVSSGPRLRTPIRDPRQYRQRSQQQMRRTAQDWKTYFDNADDAQAQAALDEWNRERMDADNRSNDTPIQRFFHNIGWSENTPEVMDEQQYQAAWQAAGRPQQIYHSDYGAGRATAKDFANQFFGRGYDFAGNQYRQYVSNGVYGDGTYFATSASDSAGYGDNQFRGFLNNKAKVISFNQLQSQYNRYANTHPAFARMMSGVTGGYGNTNEKLSIFAAMQGYNVISNGRGYYSVLDRSAVTVSTKQKRATWGMSDW